MSKQKFGPDNWLHILSNCVSNYASEGGKVEIIEDEMTGSMVIFLTSVEADDPRLHPDFVNLINWELTKQHNEREREIERVI